MNGFADVMKTSALVIVDLMLLASTATAGTDVLWDNGPWDRTSNRSSVRNSEFDSWIVDDFIISGSVSIHEFSWWSIMHRSIEPTGADLIILSQDFEKLVELYDLPMTREFESNFGQSQTHAVYIASIADLEIMLPAGHYFIGARPVYDGSVAAFTTLKVEVLGESQAYWRAAFLGVPDWTPVSHEGIGPKDASFAIIGEMLDEVIDPDEFNIIFGQLLSGDIDSLHESDDDFIRIGNRPAVSAALPVIRMIVEGETVIDEASRIVVTVETAADSRPGTPLQRIAAFDYLAQQWITIDERPATLTDSIIEVSLEDDPMRFIEPGTGRMKLRLDWFDPGPVINIGWGVRVDHVEWEVTR